MPAKSQNSEEQLIIDDGQDGSTTEGPWSRLKGLVEMALAPVPIGARVCDCFLSGVWLVLLRRIQKSIVY